MVEDPTETDVPGDAVGRRVSCGGELATVRYVGQIPPTTGLWLGVEWDNPVRGKHDGSHEGIQYFTCRHPKGGSFVRPCKASFGVDYMTALRQVYRSDTTKSSVGMDDVDSRYIELSFESSLSVSLNNTTLNGPGAERQIATTTPNVRFLNLAQTLLSCWDDVASVCQHMEVLEELNLSSNRFRLLSYPAVLCQAFGRLKVLVLNKCQLTWPQVLDCAPMWPQLEELYLEENNITELQRPEGVLGSLKTLILSLNPVLHDTVPCLSSLPSLQHLDLSRTGLSAVRFEDTPPGSQMAPFAVLKKLHVNHNNINQWWVIDEIAKLPSLVDLSCRGHQLLSSDRNPRTANQMLIAKLGQLKVLSGCEVSPEDRRGAELDYIKMFGQEWLKAGGPNQCSPQFTSAHPRYQTLINKYGAPEEGELKKPEPFALKNQLLKITFVFPDDVDHKPIQKKLPASMVVQKVKGLLHRLLNVPASDLRLTYTTPKKVGTEFQIDSDLKSLQFYSIEDGDQVLVRWS